MPRAFALAPVLALIYACTGSDPQFMPVDPDPVDSGGGGPAAEAGAPPVEAGSDAGCGNTQTDDNNCGVCGHDCGGGKCAAGACQPVTIRDGLDNVLGVTTSGNAIFWYRARGTNGAVESCALGGCAGAPTLLTGEVRQPGGAGPSGPTILSDGASVQWVAGSPDAGDPSNYVYGCAVTGCASRSPYAASGAGNSVYQLARSGAPATSDSVLYYTTDGGSIRKCPFGTCSNAGTTTNVTRLVGTDQTRLGMAIDATHVYFYESGGNSPGIYSSLLTDGVTRTPLFAPTTGSTDHLTLAGTALVSLSGTTLFLCDTVTPCAGKPVTLAENQANVTAIAGDATYVYFAVGTAGQTDGEIRACALPTCAGGPRTLARGLAYPTTVHARDGMVYWSERGTATSNTGAVKRIKP